MQFSVYNPVELIFGSGSLSKLRDTVKRFGDKAVIIVGKESAKKYGYLENVERLLKEGGVKEIKIFSGVMPNPEDWLVNKISDEVVREKADFIIGLGGGSVLDTAKAVSIVSANEGSAWDYVNYPEGPRALPYWNRPLICIPTTSGTGSEVNKYAVISNPKRKEKLVISHSLIYPRVSVVDPLLTLSMPPRLTTLTAMDAFFHALESFTNKVYHPVGDMYAMKTISIIKEYLPRVYEDPSYKEGREKLSLASTLGGYAIDFKRVGLIHGIEHPLSAHYPSVSHPEGLCALSLYVTKFNIKGNREKYESVSDILGYGVKAEGVLKAIEDMLDTFNLPKTLSELGVKREDVYKIAEDTYYLSRRLFPINPVEPSFDDIVDICERAFEGRL